MPFAMNRTEQQLSVQTQTHPSKMSSVLALANFNILNNEYANEVEGMKTKETAVVKAGSNSIEG